MDEREGKVYKAKLAEQAERYKDMADIMKEVVQMEPHKLSVEERNLLSVAYKNMVGARRAAWRTVTSIALKYQEQPANENKLKMVDELRKQIEAELDQYCSEIETLLKDHLIAKLDPDTEKEPAVFYHKMLADYFRYQAEFKSGEEKKAVTDKSCKHYESARDSAKGLPETHPILLGLALNFSVFKYEIMKEPAEARALAQQAFDDALAKLDELNEDSYKDSTLIMQLLRDNLTLWSSDQESKDDEDEQQQD